MTDPKIAKVIEQGQNQVVVLPPDVRLPGDSVEVHDEGGQIVLRSVRKTMSTAELDAAFAEIDKLAQGRFIEGGIERVPMPPDDDLPAIDPLAAE